MKFITREITTYTYTFGHIDLDNGTINNARHITTVDNLSNRTIDDICKQQNLGIHIGTTEETNMYCIPVDVFVAESKIWMEQHDERPHNMRDKNQTTMDMPE